MRGAFWWIDRWRQSGGYSGLRLDEQGAFRNLCDELWLRDGCLPDDDFTLANICGDARKWAKVKTAVLAKFYRTPEGWRNKTHDEVSAESARRAEKQAKYRAEKKRRIGNGSGNADGNADGHNRVNVPSSPFTVHRSNGIEPAKSSSIRKTDERRDDVEEARGTLRAALREVEGRHPGLTHQQILDLPQFCAPSGPVRLETCAHGPLMLATAAKIRAPIMRGAKRNCAPAWDRPDSQSADLQARAVDWTAKHWRPNYALPMDSREDLEASLAALSPPEDLAGEILTHLLFGLYPHLTHNQPQEGKTA